MWKVSPKGLFKGTLFPGRGASLFLLADRILSESQIYFSSFPRLLSDIIVHCAIIVREGICAVFSEQYGIGATMADHEKTKAQLIDELEFARKRIEEIEREAYLREMEAVKASGVGLWDWDLKSNKVSYSDEWKRQIGYEPEEIGNDLAEWQSRVHPDDQEAVVAMVEENIRNVASDFEARFRFRHKDGSYRNILAQGSVFADEKGDPVRMLGSHTEITRLVKIQQEASFHQHELELTLEATTNGIWKWNFVTDELQFSPRYYSMLGYEPDEFPADFENWKALIHPKDLDRALSVAMEYLKTKPDTYENEFRLRTKNREYRWMRASARVVERTGEGEAVRMIGVHQDITEQKQLERELILKRREIEEQNFLLERKNVALSELVAHSKRESKSLQRRISNNIEEIVLPLVSALSLAEGKHRAEYERLLERSLRDLLSENSSKFTRPELGLTPREIQICEMIKQGLSSKEISHLLNIGSRGVDSHRMNIRKKLGLVGQSTNLVTYLKSL